MSAANGTALAAVAPEQNLDAEMSALGAVLISAAALDVLLDVCNLEPDDFWRESHGAIFAAMVELRDQDQLVDRVTVTDRLKRTGRLELAGGQANVDALSASPPFEGNVREYGRIVKEAAFMRRLTSTAHEIQGLIAGHIGDPDALAEEVARRVSVVTATPTRSRRLRPMFPDGLMAVDIEDVSWRCDAFAADGHLTVLAGEGGEGKSLLTLALAQGVQHGQRVAGISCGMGKVVLIDAENGERIMAKRLKAAQMTLTDLEVYDAESIDIRSPHDQREILSACQGAQLVILDSLRMLAPGAKENDSDEMAPVLKFCKSISRRTGAAVVLIHHKGKGEGDYRGSSAIRDQTDMLFVLERHKGDPMGSKRRSVRCVKCRVDQEPPTRWFSIIGGKELAFVEAAAYDPSEGAETPVRDEIEKGVIEFMVAAVDPVSRPAIAKAIGRDPKDKTMRDAIAELVESDVLIRTDKHLYVKGVEFPDTPSTPGDTRGVDQGVLPLKGKDTSTPPTDAAA